MTLNNQSFPIYKDIYGHEMFEYGTIQNLKQIIASSNSSKIHIELAELYYDQGELQEALYHYSIGLEMNPDQDASYYHLLFELAWKQGKYKLLKQHLKNYQELYDTDTHNTERYSSSLELVFDYENWKGDYELKQLNISETVVDCGAMGNSILYIDDQGHLYSVTLKDGQVHKKRKLQLSLPKDEKIESIGLNPFTQTLIVSVKDSSGKMKLHQTIYKKRSQWQLLTELKVGHERSNLKDAYLMNDNKTLYFSSDVDGHFDLYYSIRNSVGQWQTPEALDNINTPGDDVSPVWNRHETEFYFSSDWLRSFGGKDIFLCEDYEIFQGKKRPNHSQNSKAPINSYKDELTYSEIDAQCGIVLRNDGNGRSSIWFYKKKDTINNQIVSNTYQ